MNIRKNRSSVFLAIIFISLLINLFILDNTYGLEHSGTIVNDETWHAADNPHIVTGDVTVRGSYYNNYTATLTIEPGCVIKFIPATSLFIGVGEYAYGILNAQGTSDRPILFTSNASSPAVGDWKGIYFKYTGDNTIMDYCEVEYGDNNIFCYAASPTIKNSNIRNSNNGTYASNGSSPKISCTNIQNNKYGLNATGNSNPAITNCNIIGNSEYGVYNNSSTVTLNAENNWWGDDSGPSGVGSGSGNAVSKYVDYDPWLTSPSACVPPATPIVTTGSVTNITSSSATLNGTVNANELSTLAWFEYGTASGGPYSNTNTQTVTGSTDTPVSHALSGLSASTKYYYRLVAENSVGKTEGSEKVFTTQAAKLPHIDTLSSYLGSPGTAVTINGVNFSAVQGVVNFGATTASVISWNDTSIVITIPELPPETYSISVTTGGQTSNGLSFLLTEAQSGGDFGIDVKPPMQTVVRGSSALYSVFVNPINGFNKAVTLQVDGLPQGASASFERNPVYPGAWVGLTITTTEKTPVKIHSFTVKGIASSISHGKSAKLQVKPAKMVVDLLRSYSSDLTVLLIARNKIQTGDKVVADVSIMNTTGTWVKATLKQEDYSAAISNAEDYVILLGPYTTKSLGLITFQKGESLHYDGDRTSFEPLTVLAIDLLLRGALGQEVPPNAFMDVFSYYDYADTLFGDVLRALLDEKFGCNTLAIDFGKDLKDGNAIGILNDLAEFLQCTGAIKAEMQKLFMQVLKNKKLAGKAAGYLNVGVDTLIGLLQIPDHYVEFNMLMCPSLVPPLDGYFESLGLCDTLGSPLEGWVRLEAVAEE